MSNFRPYDHEALWIKAKLFINRAMDADDLRSDDEKALWASLALELLGKAALARVSPLLIAEPTEEGANLLAASGLVEGESQFTAVRARTVFSRCAKAFRPFNLRDAQLIASARNEYLHGGGVGFLAIPIAAWWPRYWAQASILVNALDASLEEFVGLSRVKQVESFLAQNKKNIEHRVEMLVARAQQRLSQYQSGDLPARLSEEWSKSANLSVGLSHHEYAECPACGEQGMLEGDGVSDTETMYERISEDDYDVWINLTVDADYFSCDNCRLLLDDSDLIIQAGLPSQFGAVGEASDLFESEYGND